MARWEEEGGKAPGSDGTPPEAGNEGMRRAGAERSEASSGSLGPTSLVLPRRNLLLSGGSWRESLPPTLGPLPLSLREMPL